MDVLIGRFLEYLKSRQSGNLHSAEFLKNALAAFCHENIQFYLRARDSKDFQQALVAHCRPALNEDTVQEIVESVSIAVLFEEKKPLVGRYPQNIFCRSAEDAFSWIDQIYPKIKSENRLELRSANILCIGSCFATNLAKHLSSTGANVKSTVLTENVNSPRNNVALFEYLRSGTRKDLIASGSIPEAELLSARTFFAKSNVLVLTLGCAYSLIDTSSGLPAAHLASNTSFDCPTTESVAKDLQTITQICEEAGISKIYLTVSPVPLAGTLLPGLNPFISDAASKAILRASVEEAAMRGVDFTYIPSFEVFRQLPMHAFFPTLGLDDGNARHPNSFLVSYIIKRFLDNNFIQ